MKSFARRICFLCFTAILLSFTACSGKKGGSSVDPEQMKYLSMSLIGYCDGEGALPANIEGFKAWQGSKETPEAVLTQMGSGDIVVPWGVNLTNLFRIPGGIDSYVIIYEKDAPTKGGHVVMGLGNVKKVTAEEFKSLKLAHAAKDAGKVWATEGDKATADKLVGQWELTKGSGVGPIEGAILEFEPPAMRFTLNKKPVGAWNYMIEGKTLEVIPAGDGKKEKHKIKELTDTKLVTEDEKGNVEEYKKLPKVEFKR